MQLISMSIVLSIVLVLSRLVFLGVNHTLLRY